ncbi:MAG: MarR family transcriptional regulator [Rhodocyclales bacterium GT-UBC]|nr:MAG: MarR family transcriptional regulator [Rhodocyclales bacterium GT-UBC]
MSDFPSTASDDAPLLPSGFCYLIGRLDHALTRRMLDVLAPLGLTVSQYTALSFIDSQEQISNAQLAERTLISPQSANEMVKQMNEKGWIERAPDPFHGRVVRLGVTTAGKVLLLQAHAAVARLETEMLTSFTATQRKTIHGNLRQVLHTLKDLKNAE